MLRPFRWLSRRAARKPIRRETRTFLTVEHLEERCLPAYSASFLYSSYAFVTDSSPANIAVKLTGPGIGSKIINQSAVSVSYFTRAISATPGIDYTQITNGTLTWPNPNTNQVATIQVPIFNRGGVGTRTFEVDLSLPGNGAVPAYPSTTVVAITDPPSPPPSPPPPAPVTVQFSSSNYSTSDQNQFVTLTITLNQTPAGNVIVTYITRPLTAEAGQGGDYQDVINNVTFYSGTQSLSQNIQIPLFNDGLGEADESFFVDLAADPSVTLGAPSRALVTLHENAPAAPQINLHDVSVLENGGAARLTAGQSRPYSLPLTVTYQTMNGTATASADYMPVSGTLTFPANQQTLQQIAVPIINDNDPYEAPKNFTVSVPGSAAFLYNVYADLLYRDADKQGLAGWNVALSSGSMTRTQVAHKFETSIELVPAVVDRFYQRYLFRPGDGTGISYWTLQLLNTPGFTLEDLIGNLTGSPEYFGGTCGPEQQDVRANALLRHPGSPSQFCGDPVLAIAAQRE